MVLGDHIISVRGFLPIGGSQPTLETDSTRAAATQLFKQVYDASTWDSYTYKKIITFLATFPTEGP